MHLPSDHTDGQMAFLGSLSANLFSAFVGLNLTVMSHTNSYDAAPLRAFSTVSGRCVSTSSSAKLVVVVQVLYLWLHGFKSRRTGVSQTMIASLLAPWPPFIGTDPRKYGACAAETSVSIRSEPGKLLWLNWETSPRMSAAARRTK